MSLCTRSFPLSEMVQLIRGEKEWREKELFLQVVRAPVCIR